MTESSESKRRPVISLKFVVIIGVVAVAAYFGTAPLMTYMMYLQEKAKTEAAPTVHTAPSERPSFDSLK